MPHELPKSYEPGAIEARWAEYCVKEKLFSVPTPAPEAAWEWGRSLSKSEDYFRQLRWMPTLRKVATTGLLYDEGEMR